jgi:hypothetical protein
LKSSASDKDSVCSGSPRSSTSDRINTIDEEERKEIEEENSGFDSGSKGYGNNSKRSNKVG